MVGVGVGLGVSVGVRVGVAVVVGVAVGVAVAATAALRPKFSVAGPLALAVADSLNAEKPVGAAVICQVRLASLAPSGTLASGVVVRSRPSALSRRRRCQ